MRTVRASIAGRGTRRVVRGGVALRSHRANVLSVTLDDTHPEARRVQFEVLRRLTEGQRAALAVAMTSETLRWSRAAVREQMPGASEQEVILRWIELVYGEELAARVRPMAHRLGAPA